MIKLIFILDFIKNNSYNEYLLLQDLNWRSTRLNSLNNTKLALENLDYLKKKMYKTCYEIISRTTIDETDITLCDYIRNEYDQCYIFDLNLVKRNFKSIKIGFKNHDDEGYKVYIEYPSRHPTMYTNSFHVMPNKRISVYTKFRNVRICEHFLSVYGCLKLYLHFMILNLKFNLFLEYILTSK